MSRYTTPAERIAELVREHGSYRAAAEATRLSHVALYKVASGLVRQPRHAFLRGIGLDPESAMFRRLQS